jgi:hypothetical protein
MMTHVKDEKDAPKANPLEPKNHNDDVTNLE